MADAVYAASAPAFARRPSAMTSKQSSTPYIEFVESFNHNLKVLARDLAKQFPNDAMVFRAQKRAMTVIAVDPLFVIDAVGPYLYSYREQIYNLDENAEAFFLENDFDAELKASVNQEKADMVSYLIPKAKECARALPPNEKEEYKALVVSLLDDYIEYLAAVSAK
jgi:hypothetical protein